MLSLSSPTTDLIAVTKTHAKKLEKMGIFTVADLLYHFPARYDDFSLCKKIDELRLDEEVTVKGKVLEVTTRQSWKRRSRITEVLIGDETGSIKAVWFNFMQPLTFLKKGKYVRVSGKLSLSRNNEMCFTHPNFQIIPHHQIKPEEDQVIQLDDENDIGRDGPVGRLQSASTGSSGVLVPIYPETKGINSFFLVKAIRQALQSTELFEFIPNDILKTEKLLNFKKALQQIHQPNSHEEVEKAKKRFGFEKTFLVQLRVLQIKKNWDSQKAFPIDFNKELIQNFVKELPFTLTDAQKKSVWQVFQDIEKDSPMNRLLEGDVGTGKTIVAALALYLTAHQKYQAALLAPTEVLTNQHFTGITKLLSDKINIGLLTGSQAILNNKKISKPKFKEKLKNGEVDIVIGTHALLTDNVEFKSLALVIIDEQHRFGVAQRATLQQKTLKTPDGSKETIPHLLTMTATPIPRSLSLSIFGNLDLSIIDEFPKGRKKIITKVIAPNQREQVYNQIKKQILTGRQMFVICPLVQESEKLTEVKSVQKEFERLQAKVFPQLKIGLLHGKMRPKEKDAIMNDFKNKKLDILVSTSVVEVGVDVPNATVMMIEGAERFGLSQLHQFRGRVGRGQHQSYCFLLTSDNAPNTTSRLQTMEKTNDGFKIAQADLKLRGPGQFLGLSQSGQADLAMESLFDVKTISAARTQAQRILAFDPLLTQFPLLKEQLDRLAGAAHWE